MMRYEPNCKHNMRYTFHTSLDGVSVGTLEGPRDGLLVG